MSFCSMHSMYFILSIFLLHLLRGYKSSPNSIIAVDKSVYGIIRKYLYFCFHSVIPNIYVRWSTELIQIIQLLELNWSWNKIEKYHSMDVHSNKQKWISDMERSYNWIGHCDCMFYIPLKNGLKNHPFHSKQWIHELVIIKFTIWIEAPGYQHNVIGIRHQGV